MKIFPRYYARRLYRTTSLEEILETLISWKTLVLRPGSPFLRQIASYFFPTGSSTPRFFKEVLGDEILRVVGREDMESIIDLAIVASYRRFNPRGGTGLVGWLSWTIPYECSKWVYWRGLHPVFGEEYYDVALEEFETYNWTKERIAILCNEAGLCKQSKYYWSGKAIYDNNIKSSAVCRNGKG